jgi:hypothetical protein
MIQKLLGLDTASSAYTFLSERGILSGFYVGMLAFGVILGNSITSINSEFYIWLAIICFVFGLIIANVSYEVFLPVFRSITDVMLVKSFHQTAKGDAKKKFPNYAEIRIFRESFIASNAPDHLKAKILKDEGLRLTLTYLNSASIVGFLILFVAFRYYSVYPSVISIEVIVNSFIFIMTFIGRFPRSSSLGVDIGIAYLHTIQNQQEGKPKKS